MSFKRDGDDVDLLRSLKHRRVCELLSNHIPDDEAMLLKNGRLTCLICTHRPIFDTLSMLAIHRKGKKHVNELGKFLSHKRDLDIKKLKLEHRRYLRTGLVVDSASSHGPLPPTSQSSMLLITQVPYGSCNKRRFAGLQRKTILDIQSISTETDLPGVTTKNSPVPSASAQVRRYLKGLWKKKPLEKTVAKTRENYGESQMKGTTNIPGETCHQSRLEQPVTEVIIARNGTDDMAMRKQAEHELKLRMSGWIKNDDGSWVHDPNVEFDSDEDEPPISPD